jgi:hypothetical protein
VRSLQDQWRSPGPQVMAVGPGPKSFVERVGRRTAPTFGSSPGPGPAATLPAPAAGAAPARPIPDDPQKRRDQVYQEYAASLGNAWRSPGAGPSNIGPSASWKGPAA